jgi:O-antigen/teichoic acid export membrane protein
MALGDKTKVIRFCRKVALMSLCIFIVLCTGVMLVLPFFTPYFPNDLVTLCYPLLLILIIGLVIFSTTIPLDHILIQAGQPGNQSLLMSINVMINILLNLALIPVFGLYGAASATAIAFICATFIVHLAARKWLGYQRGLLFFKN